MFVAQTDGIDRYALDVAGGRWIVLMVFATLGAPACLAAHDAVRARRDLFDDRRACFFGVSADPLDRTQRGLCNLTPGLRYFWDFEHAISRLYGLNNGVNLRPAVFLIDPMLRIAAAEPIERTGEVLERLADHLAEDDAEAPFAPVLDLPRVLEDEVCSALIDHYRQVGGSESGFAANLDGRTVQRVDSRLKRRRDVLIEDESLRLEVKARLERRLLPMIKRAWGWQASEIERYLIACYDSADQGFFSAHRDDATAGTAHRRFAVSINLNGGYDGGALRFPEFGRRLYKPSPGGAVVFGCSLLHEATPVTRGVRYALVPFLYDEQGARLRRANLALVGAGPDPPPRGRGGRGVR